ncbi:MAG: NAD-dependent epimerase/dehydratase family protein, partial [Streptosporangiaceae bacterium]
MTGGSGFLGEYVLRAATARGHEVTALARSRAAAAKVGWLG